MPLDTETSKTRTANASAGKEPIKADVFDLRKRVEVEEVDESWALALLEDQDIDPPIVLVSNDSPSAIQRQAREIEEARRNAKASNDASGIKKVINRLFGSKA